MPVGFPIMDFYSEFATYGDYGIGPAFRYPEATTRGADRFRR